MLDAYARDIGTGPDKTVIVLIDNAGWRVSPGLNVPDGFCFPPPYTPELRPAGRPRRPPTRAPPTRRSIERIQNAWNRSEFASPRPP